MKEIFNRRRCGSNATDKKVIIKRRADGVYDIYVDDTFVTSKGSASSAASFVESLLMEETA